MDLLNIKCYTACFKKCFTILEAYTNLFRGHIQYFELHTVA
jgi:hypothetical protein